MLKRLRATPLPRWTYSSERLGSAVIVTTCSVTAVLAVGVVLFHAHIATPSLAPLAASAVGLVATFALGSATASLIPSSEAALPIAYALLLPVAFISGVFSPRRVRLDGCTCSRKHPRAAHRQFDGVRLSPAHPMA